MNNLRVGDRWRPFINPPVKLPPGYIELTLTDGTIVNGMTAADVATCSTFDKDDTNITVGGVTFRKNQVKKVKFGKDFDLTSLDRFGTYFTNLIEIDPIPEGVNGYHCLRNFLFGCKSFNQPITIPEGITGLFCLQSFLSNCTSFNQPITIPEGVTGGYCLYGFLHGCKSFNQPITIPEGVTGDGCLGNFLISCTSFNQPITIPEGVSGMECLKNFLEGCTSFNQPVTIPNTISGENCLAELFYGCTSFNSPITISEGDNIINMGYTFYECTSFNQPITIPNNVDNIDGFLKNCDDMISPITINNEEIRANDYTFATRNPLAPMYTQGIPIIGPGADAFKTKFPNSDMDPYRNLI